MKIRVIVLGWAAIWSKSPFRVVFPSFHTPWYTPLVSVQPLISSHQVNELKEYAATL